MFRALSLGLLGGLLVIRVFYAIRGRRQGGQQMLSRQAMRREGTLGTAIRLVLAVAFFSVAGVYAAAPRLTATFNVPLPAGVRWLGFAIGVLDLALLIWVHHALGRQWSTSLELQRGHELVTTGPYGWVRHPMYTALVVILFALGLVAANLLIALPSIGGILFVVARIGREERMMLEAFGDDYRRYMSRTGRLLPRWSQMRH